MTEILNVIKRLWSAYGLLILLGGIFLLVGLGLLGWGITSSYRAFRSQNWPIVQGMINESTLESRVESDNEGSTVMYSAEIRYTYTVNGVNYSSSRVSMGDYSSSNPNSIRKIVARYPSGSMVEVRYDPSNPNEALLEPGFNGGLLIPLGIGAVFSVVGGLISTWIIRNLLTGGDLNEPG